MTKKLLIGLILLVGSIVFLQRQPLVLASPSLQDATPTPAAEEEAHEEAEEAAEPTLQELLARIEALEAQLAPASLINQVTTAVYLLDSAGLHALDVRLNQEGVIEAGDAGTVTRVARLLSTVAWPTALASDAQALIAVMDQLATALAADDVATAAPLATQTHEMQHDLSHAAEHWLGAANTLGKSSAPTEQANQVTTAVYLLDSAGLHALDVRLNEDGAIEAGDAGGVTRIARLLSTVDWPTPLATDAMSLTTVLNDLATALTNDDVASAAPLATQVHEVQHDFSHAAEHWLGESHAVAGQANRVTTAVYLLDNAGLHALDVRLNEEGVIEASDAGGVTRVARLLSTVDWPEPLATDVVTLTTVLHDLATALTNDDGASAAPLATQAHEVQHDFSHAAEHWLGEASGGHAEGENSDHGDEAADDHAHEDAEEAPAEEGADAANNGG